MFIDEEFLSIYLYKSKKSKSINKYKYLIKLTIITRKLILFLNIIIKLSLLKIVVKFITILKSIIFKLLSLFITRSLLLLFKVMIFSRWIKSLTVRELKGKNKNGI